MANSGLTYLKLKNLKAKGKPYKVADRDGLYVLVTKTGSKSFRYNYAFGGKAKTMTYGRFPETELADARALQVETKRLLAKGIDPNAQKRTQKEAKVAMSTCTFGAVADRWADARIREGKAPATLSKDQLFLRTAKKEFGDTQINQISHQMMLRLLTKLLDEGQTNWPYRFREKASGVFKHAVAEGIECRNIAAEVAAALGSRPAPKNHPFIRDLTRVGLLIRDSQQYSGDLRVRIALCILPHVFLRPGELRYAQWDQFDFKKRIWTVPSPQMKEKLEHLVPLTDQTIGLLRILEPLKDESPYVFQGQTTKCQPISENTINRALRNMGYSSEEIVGHGFRGFASTTLNNSGFEWHVVEKQLAHRIGNVVSQTYNKAEYLEQRIKMMEWWSGYLEGLEAKAA
ncbi:MAG: tyrosine-type recombinase/integrase [Hyphomonas sp.]|nr:tyrosine-type recombinase/integrase [Hyphomonas sp.]